MIRYDLSNLILFDEEILKREASILYVCDFDLNLLIRYYFVVVV